MQRRHMVSGAIIAIAVLLPLSRWVTASRQQAAARIEDLKVEKQFVASRTAAGQQMADGPGQWGARQGGRRPGGWGGQGQSRQRGQGRRDMMTRMVKEVGLTPAQVKQLQAVRDSSRPMMSDVFRNPQLTREQKMAAVQQIRQAQQTQVGKFLTLDQQAKYTAFQEKMRQQRQTWRGTGGPGFPGGPGGASAVSAGGNGGQSGGG